jgi:iron complex transport system substrate-binding protein
MLYPPVIAARDPIVVRDFAGREVRLAQPAGRIVALAPHIVENAFTAGAGDKLVGAVSYSDYPAAARAISRVGSHQSWSLEAVVALQPDLVLLWGSGNGMDALASLERVGIPVFVSESRLLEDIPATIRAIGVLAGTRAVSDVQAASLERGLAAVAERYSTAPSLSVFYQIWNDPLQTVNGEHLISRVINLCGASNVFADAVPLAPRVSLESVLLRDPEVILASGMGEARPDWLDHWQRYPTLQAVRAGALLFVHPDLIQRPTARILRGAQQLCAKLDDVRRGQSHYPDAR